MAKQDNIIFIIGPGNVGRQLLEQLALRYHEVGIVIADSQHLLSTPTFAKILTGIIDVKAKTGRLRGLESKLTLEAREDEKALFSRIGEGDIVFNCMPTVFPNAHSNGKEIPNPVKYDLQALLRGADVIAAHKSAFAHENYYRMLLNAKQNRGNYIPAGAVMGPTRAFEVVSYLKAMGVEITAARGRINGTTVFIPYHMLLGDGSSYSTAIIKAQELGYAEPDPSGDVEGHDSLAKMKAIAMSIGTLSSTEIFGIDDERAKLPKELAIPNGKYYGIVGVDLNLLEGLKSRGLELGLVASYNPKTGSVQVGPEILTQDDPLYGLTGTANRLTLTLGSDFNAPNMIEKLYGPVNRIDQYRDNNGGIKDTIHVEFPTRDSTPKGYDIGFVYDKGNRTLTITGPGAGSAETAVALLHSAQTLRPDFFQRYSNPA